VWRWRSPYTSYLFSLGGRSPPVVFFDVTHAWRRSTVYMTLRAPFPLRSWASIFLAPQRLFTSSQPPDEPQPSRNSGQCASRWSRSLLLTLFFILVPYSRGLSARSKLSQTDHVGVFPDARAACLAYPPSRYFLRGAMYVPSRFLQSLLALYRGQLSSSPPKRKCAFAGCAGEASVPVHPEVLTLPLSPEMVTFP